MIYVMLPAYNEEKCLPLLLDNFYRVFQEISMPYKVVVVDDGSVDHTASIAKQYALRMPLELIKHGVNKGLGAAMRTGLSHVAETSRPTDVIVTMDADNTHNPEVLLEMLKKVEQGADVVIASRYQTGGDEVGLEVHRKMLSRGASLLLGLFFRVEGASDYTCGYRMYRCSVIKNALKRYGKALITENGFVCMAEILVKVAYLPATIAEVPLILRYDLKEGVSKMKKIKTIIQYLKFIAREKRNGLEIPAQ
jgi:dolichol-phosphate mannosyltransferase